MRNRIGFRTLPAKYDTLAPDGSEIRELAATGRASMVHCTLAPDRVSAPVAHRTVEELWFCLEGSGQLWRSLDGHETIVDLAPGVSASIPLGTRFQFRCSGFEPLRILIATAPAWPGPDEAYAVPGRWPPKP